VTGSVVDRHLGARWRGDDYNCLHFATDVWRDLTGEDVTEGLIATMAQTTAERRMTRRAVRAFSRLEGPQDPCLVLMRRPRSEPHVGVFMRGRVLHLTERGAEFMEPAVASRGFKEVVYFR